MNYTKGEWFPMSQTLGYCVMSKTPARNLLVADRLSAKDDAHLISAAPDMYSALRQALTDVEVSNGYLTICLNTLEAIKQALAKAEGK